MLSTTFMLLLSSALVMLRLGDNTSSFPRPLKPKEEEECVQRMLTGDLEARNTLIEHNLRLVMHIIKKYYTTAADAEDLVSIGTIGLIKGVSTFRPDRGVRLATYASRCIENEILMFIRKNSHRKKEISIDEPLSVDYDGNELLLLDVLGSEIDSVSRELEEDEERKIVRDAVSDLNERERMIVEMRFGLFGKEELTQKEVADKLGISQSYISRLEKKIMHRLRKKIEQKI